jgi:hypothetical protein
VLFGAARNQGNSEKPLVKRLGPVYKSPTFAFACSWWSRAPTASFQVKTEMKTGSFHLSFISDLPHFSISFLTVNGTIVTQRKKPDSRLQNVSTISLEPTVLQFAVLIYLGPHHVCAPLLREKMPI